MKHPIQEMMEQRRQGKNAAFLPIVPLTRWRWKLY